MLNKYNNKEKSLTRRFLLILGVITFIGFFGFGLMIIFWDKIPLDLPKYQRVIFGAVVVLYSFLRFSRLLKKQPYEE